ncbi:MAG: protein TolR [Desulfobulbus propionicus]|nr:MAG: protein TolR [Desulfobulbus propionicus]
MGVSGTRGGRGRRGLVADINVTPLVDVMLVLLIVFMVAAPMMTQGIEVNLPKTTNKSLAQEDEPVVVTLNKDGEIFLGKVKMDITLLRQQLSAATPEQKQEPVYLRADKTVPYGMVMETMGCIKASGYEKLGMITEPDEKKQ